jgi:small subunit ribosomal protein S11
MAEKKQTGTTISLKDKDQQAEKQVERKVPTEGTVEAGEKEFSDQSLSQQEAEFTKKTEKEVKDQKQEDEKKEEKRKDEEKLSLEQVKQTESSAKSKERGRFKSKGRKRARRRQVFKGKAFIKSTYNNTVVSFTDLHGGLLAWSSAGLLGFKGAKKATTYAASQVAADAIEKVQRYGLKDIEVYVKGVGSGREAAVRMLAQKGLNLILIKDRTPIPHNGCRPKKPRRV